MTDLLMRMTAERCARMRIAPPTTEPARFCQTWGWDDLADEWRRTAQNGPRTSESVEEVPEVGKRSEVRQKGRNAGGIEDTGKTEGA